MQTALLLQQWSIETLKTALLWPVWWYSKGLLVVVKWAFSMLQNQAKSLNLKAWVKNLLVPMYGLRDWQSRLISIAARFLTIFFKGFLVMILTLTLTVGMIVYMALPVGLVALIFIQFI